MADLLQMFTLVSTCQLTVLPFFVMHDTILWSNAPIPRVILHRMVTNILTRYLGLLLIGTGKNSNMRHRCNCWTASCLINLAHTCLAAFSHWCRIPAEGFVGLQPTEDLQRPGGNWHKYSKSWLGLLEQAWTVVMHLAQDASVYSERHGGSMH